MDYLQYLIFKKCKEKLQVWSFKPYYKWITFNTYLLFGLLEIKKVLNLIINGLPSILQS
mgnify:CR=1 FL=1